MRAEKIITVGSKIDLPSNLEGELRHAWIARSGLFDLYQHLGVGRLCDCLDVFHPELLRKLPEGTFLSDFIPAWDESIVFGASDDGRSLVLVSRGDFSRFIYIDWKMDSAIECSTWAELFECYSVKSDLVGRFERPIYVTSAMVEESFSVIEPNQGSALEIVRESFEDAFFVTWQEKGGIIDHVIDSKRRLMVSVLHENEHPEKITINYERSSEGRDRAMRCVKRLALL